MSARVFKPVSTGGSLKFISAKQLADDGKTGIILEGMYIAAIPNQHDDTKNDYKFEAEVDNELTGVKAGDTVVVNNTGSLNYQMEKVTPGSLVQLTYNGKDKLTKGKNIGKSAHNFLVSVAEEA